MKKARFKSMKDADLARFQTLQQGNDCSMHAIAAAIGMLTGKKPDGHALARLADRLWWQGRFYRLWPGWAVTPRMQAGFLNYLARQEGLPLQARLLHLSPEVLRNLPHDSKLAVIVSIYWFRNQVPGIYLGNSLNNFNATEKTGAHAMVLAAYDEEHQLVDGRHAPWGFINSWVQGGEALFWMTDEDFRRSWRFLPPLLGNNPAVLIWNTENTAARKAETV